jgi:acetyl-CoA C-acetyltransferase
MNRYGTTEEQFALVSVKNHKYGAKNPYAMFQKEITVDDVLKSRVVASPLKLYDCCVNADGAACIILAGGERARKITRCSRLDNWTGSSVESDVAHEPE